MRHYTSYHAVWRTDAYCQINLAIGNIPQNQIISVSDAGNNSRATAWVRQNDIGQIVGNSYIQSQDGNSGGTPKASPIQTAVSAFTAQPNGSYIAHFYVFSPSLEAKVNGTLTSAATGWGSSHCWWEHTNPSAVLQFPGQQGGGGGGGD